MRASELRKFSHFRIKKLLFLSIFCWYTSDTLSRNIYIFRTQITSASMQFPFYYLWYMALYKRQYADRTLTLRKSMYIYASELRKLLNFHILKLLLFSQYFVGTSDTLSVQVTCLSAYMYRQISKCTEKTPKKHYCGAIAPLPPPPPFPAN